MCAGEQETHRWLQLLREAVNGSGGEAVNASGEAVNGSGGEAVNASGEAVKASRRAARSAAWADSP